MNNAKNNRARSFSGKNSRRDERCEDAEEPKKTSKNSLMMAGAVVLGCTALIAVWAFKHLSSGSGISLQAQSSIASDSYQYGGSYQQQAPSLSYYAPAQNYSSLPRASFHAQGTASSYGNSNLAPAAFHGASHKRHRAH